MEETTVDEPADTELTLTLVRVFGRFRRQLTRLAGRTFDQPGISGAQAEFLRLVGRNPGISVKAAASELGLVPNTVSTFVTALVQAELLVREPDPQDRRVGRLSLPAAIQHTVDQRRRVRHSALGAALAELTPQQRTELERGLAVVGELTNRLHRHEQGSTA